MKKIAALSVAAATVLVAFATAACATASVPAPEAPSSLEGTWSFDVASSSPGAQLRADCDAKGAAAASCWEDVKRETAGEKLRFHNESDGRTTFTSFGVDESGKETVFRQATLDAKTTLPVHLERIDARTIAVDDPSKGRLVYVKE